MKRKELPRAGNTAGSEDTRDIRDVIAAARRAAAKVTGTRADAITTWLKPWRFPTIASADLEREHEQRVVLVAGTALGRIVNVDERGLLPPRVVDSLDDPDVKLRLLWAYLRELVARSRQVGYTVEPLGMAITSASLGVEDLLPEVTHPLHGRPIWFLANLVESRFLSPEHRAQFARTQDNIVQMAKEGRAAFPDVTLFLRNENVRRPEWRGLCRVEIHAEPIFGGRDELVERLIIVSIEQEARSEVEVKAIDTHKAFRINALASTERTHDGTIETTKQLKTVSKPPSHDGAPLPRKDSRGGDLAAAVSQRVRQTVEAHMQSLIGHLGEAAAVEAHKALHELGDRRQVASRRAVEAYIDEANTEELRELAFQISRRISLMEGKGVSEEKVVKVGRYTYRQRGGKYWYIHFTEGSGTRSIYLGQAPSFVPQEDLAATKKKGA